MSKTFLTASQILTGENAVAAAAEILCTFGEKAFIVTGRTVSTLPCFLNLTKTLTEAQIGYEIFQDILGEPDDRMIHAGAERFKASGCDFLIAMGGGSPLDAMKAIAVISCCGGEIADYMGKEIQGNLPKMVAIPTTAGTGSEVTQFTIITDTATKVKMLLKGRCLVPDLAIVDGANTVSSPKRGTAATALDALTHAVESYTSQKAQMLTDGLSLSAIRRIFRWLPVAYNDGTNLQARSELSIAALEAGMSINNASVTIVHGMSRPIGALFHVPHGISNAMLLTKCMKFACDGAYGRFAEMARAIGAADAQTGEEEAAKRFLEALQDLCMKCEIPTLEKYGIERNVFFANMDKMADDAMQSGSPGNTRKEVTKQDILSIYKSLWEEE
ncbi:MAG: iron-containing alcohol dehydrogenase [Bacillota bacterium]|jgi:alcohol dehydrogenase class IV